MKQHNQHGRLIVALLLALIVPILVACGGAQPAANAPAATQATAASAPANTSAPAAAPAATAPEAAAPTAASAPETPPTGGGGSLRVAASAGTWPDTLAPQKSSFSNEIAVLLMNYEGLTRFDGNLKTVPAAAEKWEYNQDATQITFHLRDGLKYSDGSPLTAQDFVNAVYRTLDPHSPGDYQTSLNMIKGADAIINTTVPTDEAKLPDLDKALGVKATDDKTLVFDLTQPTPFFHTLAGIWVMFPAKQDLIDKGGDQWYEDAANQVGNGPFQITKIDKASNLIEFKANQNYWRGRPKLDTVQYTYIQDLSVALQAYKSNEVDIIAPDPNDVPTIKSDPVLGPEFKEYAGGCTYALTFNLTKAPFDNPKVREAFAYAYDRESVIRDAYKDTEVKTLTWIPPGYPGYDQNAKHFEFDPAKAKQLLAEAGYPDGKGLPELKYTYGSNNPANQPRAEYIIQMFQKSLGITITPDPVENTTLTSMRKDVNTYPQMTRAGWCADYPDPQDWLSVVWQSNQAFAADTGYKNAEVDRLTQEGDSLADEAKRMADYAKAQDLIITDVPQVITSNTKNYYLIKPYVKGLEFTPQDSDLPGQITSLYDVTVQK